MHIVLTIFLYLATAHLYAASQQYTTTLTDEDNSSGEWTITDTRIPYSIGVKKTLSLKSSDNLNVSLKIQNDGDNIFAEINTHFYFGNEGTHYVTFQFDYEVEKKEHWNSGKDKWTLYPEDMNQFLSDIQNSKTLYILVKDTEGTEHNINFDLTGIEEAYKKII